MAKRYKRIAAQMAVRKMQPHKGAVVLTGKRRILRRERLLPMKDGRPARP